MSIIEKPEHSGGAVVKGHCFAIDRGFEQIRPEGADANVIFMS